MIDDLTLHMREGFLKYLLFKYNIQKKETVWVLNYLKDHPQLERFIFLPPNRQLTEGMTLTKNFQLLFQYKGLIITEPDVMIQLLKQLDSEYYFYLSFDDAKIKPLQLNERMNQLLSNRLDLEGIILNREEKNQLNRLIDNQLDLTLITHNKEDFLYYSNLKKQLKDG